MGNEEIIRHEAFAGASVLNNKKEWEGSYSKFSALFELQILIPQVTRFWLMSTYICRQKIDANPSDSS